MIHVNSLLIFVLVLIFSFIPGYSVFYMLFRNVKKSWVEVIIFSVVISFFMNILFVQIFKLLNIVISPLYILVYILIFATIFIHKFSLKKILKVQKYEKYVYILFFLYFIVFGGMLLFGYTGNKYGDFVNHLNNIKGTVEEGLPPENHHYFYFDAPSRYPKGFTSMLVLPFILLDESDALTIAQVMTWFSRLIPLFFAMLIFIATRLFVNYDKVGFYSCFIFLGLDMALLLPIYWGGLPTNFSRLMMFGTFICLWHALKEKDNYHAYIFLAAIFSVTGLTIRPDVSIYFPIMFFSIWLFVFKYRMQLVRLFVYYGLVSLLFVVVFIPNYITTYIWVVTNTVNVEGFALLGGLFEIVRFVPLIPFLFLAFFSFYKNEVRELFLLGLSFIFFVPFIMWTDIIFVSHHIFSTFTIPFSIICGVTLERFSRKNFMKVVLILFFVFITLLFIGVNVRQHYLVDVPLQENELGPIYWLKYNIPSDSNVFYLYTKDYDLTSDFEGSNLVYRPLGLQHLISPYAEKNALSMWSTYSVELERVSKEFWAVAQGIDEGNVSVAQFHEFLSLNNFTHIFLMRDQYYAYNMFFEDFNMIYDDEGYIVLVT